MNESRAVWWVKRDMRLSDNEALCAALENHQQVVALFICEPSLYDADETSPMHVFAWWQTLTALQAALRDIGVNCILQKEKRRPYSATYTTSIILMPFIAMKKPVPRLQTSSSSETPFLVRLPKLIHGKAANHLAI